VSFADRSGSLAAFSISLALHLAVAIWFGLRPPMFKPVRPQPPIEVMLVPARPLPAAEAGGGGRTEEQLVRAPPPDIAPRPARPRTPRPAAPRAAPPPAPAPMAPVLPQAREVDPAPASEAASVADDEALAPAVAGAPDLGIGTGGLGGSGGGTGGGVGSGTGTGTGPGPGRGVVEVKPRELRRPSYAEMRRLYPEEARRDGRQAKIRLQLLVDTSGRVADVRVVRAAGYGFDEAAVALARRFLFEPGRRDGRPAAMWITLTYSFVIEG
jgi:protein TonB